jgi:hypothetical protein
MEHYVDTDRIERENNSAIRGSLHDAGVKQRVDVRVHGLYITVQSACRLADCPRPAPAMARINSHRFASTTGTEALA